MRCIKPEALLHSAAVGRQKHWESAPAGGFRGEHLAGLARQGIYVPEMLPELTRQRGGGMEGGEGRRLRRAGQNGQGPSFAELQEDLKLVEVGVQCSLEQVRLRRPGAAPARACCQAMQAATGAWLTLISWLEWMPSSGDPVRVGGVVLLVASCDPALRHLHAVATTRAAGAWRYI